MRVLDAAKIARKRFNRSAWLGYLGNGWRTDRRGWRNLVRNTKLLCEKRGLTLEDFS
jgi:hypothetical protein